MATSNLSADQLKAARTQARRFLRAEQPVVDKTRWDTVTTASESFLAWLDGNENTSIANALREGDTINEVYDILKTQLRYLKVKGSKKSPGYSIAHAGICLTNSFSETSGSGSQRSAVEGTG
jgi:hypothetical protein